MRQWRHSARRSPRAPTWSCSSRGGPPDMPSPPTRGSCTTTPRAGALPLPAARTRDAARRRVVSPPRLPHRRAAPAGDVRGEGDALFQPGAPLIWGGYGVRTSLQAHRHLAEMLDVEVVPLRLVDERFYHLAPASARSRGTRLLLPDAFDRESLDRIAARVPAEQRCEVDAADALHFACNAVVTGGAVITNFASDALRERLAGWGHESSSARWGSSCWRAAPPSAWSSSSSTRARGGARASRASRPRCASARSRSRATSRHGPDERHARPHHRRRGRLRDRGLPAGLRHDQASLARVRVVAPSPSAWTRSSRGHPAGARVAEDEHDARLEGGRAGGGRAPRLLQHEHLPDRRAVRGRWVRAARQRMDAVLVVDGAPGEPRVTCCLIRELRRGDLVVCGVDGVRTEPTHVPRAGETFGFMTADASSERRVELSVERIAWRCGGSASAAGRSSWSRARSSSTPAAARTWRASSTAATCRRSSAGTGSRRTTSSRRSSAPRSAWT